VLVILLLGGAVRAESALPRYLDKHVALLHAEDPDTVRAALQTLGKARHPAAVDVIAAFLREGQPDPLSAAALVALGASERKEALAVLAEYTRHRRAAARRIAYEAVARIPDPRAIDVLVQGLRDSDPGVRGVAANALGSLGATRTLDTLALALRRGVPEAAPAIGRIADATNIAKLHAELQRQPIRVMLAGYSVFLQRDDVDEEAQLDTVARLGELASPEVKRFLQALLVTARFHERERLREAVATTAQRIVDGSPPAKTSGAK
jgi:HEAT repeat protein